MLLKWWGQLWSRLWGRAVAAHYERYVSPEVLKELKAPLPESPPDQDIQRDGKPKP